MKSSVALLGLCGALAFPQFAAAQNSDSDYGVEADTWELVLAGSGSNDNDFDTGGFSGLGQIGYFMSENLELIGRGQLDFAETDPGGSTTVATTVVGMDYHFEVGDAQRIVPFLGANVGGIYGDGVREQFIAAPEAGFKLFVTPRAFLLGLAQYQFLFEHSDDIDEGWDDGRFVYTIGFGFNW
jgi:hypothetical protein